MLWHWLDLSVEETAELLNCSGGQPVVIQAPVSLGWDRAELAKFASGVQRLVTRSQRVGRVCLAA